MRVRLRQETGEVSPIAWLGSAFGAVTIASTALFSYAWIGMLAALILAGAFGLIAVLCFFAAGKQRYINIGMERGAAGVERSPMSDAARTVPTPAPMKKPARIEYVGVESDADLSVFTSAIVRRSARHGGYDQRGLLVAFRHVGGRSVAVNAHLVFVNDSSGAAVRVNYGTWLDAPTRTALFYAGDT